MAHLNANTLEVFLIAASRAFNSRVPATEKALSLSPNFVPVRSLSNWLGFVNLVVVSTMYDGLVPLHTAYITRQACNESDKRPAASVAKA